MAWHRMSMCVAREMQYLDLKLCIAIMPSPSCKPHLQHVDVGLLNARQADGGGLHVKGKFAGQGLGGRAAGEHRLDIDGVVCSSACLLCNLL